jgi:hypothetical protein
MVAMQQQEEAKTIDFGVSSVKADELYIYIYIYGEVKPTSLVIGI